MLVPGLRRTLGDALQNTKEDITIVQFESSRFKHRCDLFYICDRFALHPTRRLGKVLGSLGASLGANLGNILASLGPLGGNLGVLGGLVGITRAVLEINWGNPGLSRRDFLGPSG